MFSTDLTKSNCSAEFNAGIQQLRDWKIYHTEHRKEAIEQLGIFLRPEKMLENPIEFKYVLVYGRSAERDINPKRTHQINQIRDETKFEIITFDTIISLYQSNPKPRNRIIVSPYKGIFRVKHLQCEPQGLFSYVRPSEIIFDADQIEWLKKMDYDLDSWFGGEMLTYNDKYPMRRMDEEIKSGKISGSK